MLCTYCSNPLTTRWQKKFCSLSCAASYNNKKYPKIKKFLNYTCKCGQKKSAYAKNCLRCKQRKDIENFNKKTLKEVRYEKGNQSIKWCFVRRKAIRVLEFEGRPKKCEFCGWKHYVEAIHLKPISSFVLDTLVKIVNHPKNLKWACPNCHWLYDHKKEVLNAKIAKLVTAPG